MSIGRRGKLICNFCQEEITDEVITVTRSSLRYPGKTEIHACSDECLTDLFEDTIFERVERELKLWFSKLCLMCRRALE